MERKNSGRYQEKERVSKTDRHVNARRQLVNMIQKAQAARDVPFGERWAFPDHRTMAEVMRDELG
jgi:hypothetical protein